MIWSSIDSLVVASPKTMHLSCLRGAPKPPQKIHSKNDSRADANGFIEQYINVIFLKAAKNDVIFFLFFLIPDFYMFWYLFLSTVIISTYWSLFFKNPIVCVWKYQSKSTVFQYCCSNVSDVLKQCVYIKMFDMMLVKHIYFQRFLTF